MLALMKFSIKSWGEIWSVFKTVKNHLAPIEEVDAYVLSLPRTDGAVMGETGRNLHLNIQRTAGYL